MTSANRNAGRASTLAGRWLSLSGFVLGESLSDRDIDAIQLSIRRSETWTGGETRFLSG